MRLELELSQKEMAAALGMQESQYCRLEKGQRNPTILSLIELTDLFEYDFEIKIKKKRGKTSFLFCVLDKDHHRLVAIRFVREVNHRHLLACNPSCAKLDIFKTALI